MRTKKKHLDSESVPMAIRLPRNVLEALDQKAEDETKANGFLVTRTDMIRKALLRFLLP